MPSEKFRKIYSAWQVLQAVNLPKVISSNAKKIIKLENFEAHLDNCAMPHTVVALSFKPENKNEINKPVATAQQIFIFICV